MVAPRPDAAAFSVAIVVALGNVPQEEGMRISSSQSKAAANRSPLVCPPQASPERSPDISMEHLPAYRTKLPAADLGTLPAFPPPGGDYSGITDYELHRLRITGKKLRSVVEFFKGRPGRRFRCRLRQHRTLCLYAVPKSLPI
jgi:hypothetical protein